MRGMKRWEAVQLRALRAWWAGGEVRRAGSPSFMPGSCRASPLEGASASSVTSCHRQVVRPVAVPPAVAVAALDSTVRHPMLANTLVCQRRKRAAAHHTASHEPRAIGGGLRSGRQGALRHRRLEMFPNSARATERPVTAHGMTAVEDSSGRSPPASTTAMCQTLVTRRDAELAHPRNIVQFTPHLRCGQARCPERRLDGNGRRGEADA
jgi:hypothetical protein